MAFFLHIAGGRFELAADEGASSEIQRRLTDAARLDQRFRLVSGGTVIVHSSSAAPWVLEEVPAA